MAAGVSSPSSPVEQVFQTITLSETPPPSEGASQIIAAAIRGCKVHVDISLIDIQIVLRQEPRYGLSSRPSRIAILCG